MSQNGFAGMVDSGLMKGDKVNVITGTHGEADGTYLPDRSMYNDDRKRFGNLPGVKVYNFPDMTPDEVRAVIDGPGTTITGFCDSEACLAAYK